MNQEFTLGEVQEPPSVGLRAVPCIALTTYRVVSFCRIGVKSPYLKRGDPPYQTKGFDRLPVWADGDDRLRRSIPRDHLCRASRGGGNQKGLHLKVAHALHGKVRKLIYSSPV